jgi:hypothetical protein
MTRLITRRDFGRSSLAAAAGVSLLGTDAMHARQNPTRLSRVVIVRDEAVLDSAHRVDKTVLQRMLDQTILEYSGCKNVKEGWSTLFSGKDKVGLLPSPHLNPTHQELVDLVKNAVQTHIGLSEKNVILIPRGDADLVASCTALVALPGLKAHWLTGIGTVLKNYIMLSGNPQAYHDEKNAKLGEIWRLPHVEGKTKLVLVDALYPLCDKGPQPDPRYKWHYNGLIAGTDPVAVETVCLQILMKKRELIKGGPWPLNPPPLCVEAADKIYGLGTSRMDEIVIERSGWQKDILI